MVHSYHPRVRPPSYCHLPLRTWLALSEESSLLYELPQNKLKWIHCRDRVRWIAKIFLPTSCSAEEKVFPRILDDAGILRISQRYYKEYCALVVWPLISERNQSRQDNPNKVLLPPSPPVDPAKQLLPCSFRSARSLAQIWWLLTDSVLPSLCWVGRWPKCPDCHSTSHTVAHLFNCPSHSKDLAPGDMWVAPFQFLACNPYGYRNPYNNIIFINFIIHFSQIFLISRNICVWSHC